MKFLLIRPGDCEKINKFFITSPLSHPPLGLLYLGAALERDGHKVEVLDYYAEDISREQLEKSLNSSDVVGMMVYTIDYKSAVSISRMIKEINPEIPLIIGGPHCTFLQKQSLLDVPDANILVFQRVTHSRRIFVQQLGRGLRIRSSMREGSWRLEYWIPGTGR